MNKFMLLNNSEGCGKLSVLFQGTLKECKVEKEKYMNVFDDVNENYLIVKKVEGELK